MHTIDWLIMLLPITIALCISVYARQFLRGVADFMVGGRGAGRYLVSAARSEQGSGAAGFIGRYQALAISGFILNWWGFVGTAIGIFVASTGFVIYRYRQTRAMTLGQFFEQRYSRKFRIFSGCLGFFAGILNFGIIPIYGARFMVYFLGLPPSVDVLGLHLDTTLLLMALFLTVSVLSTSLGGQISVMLSDCFEAMTSQIFYTIIAVVAFFSVFSWSDSRELFLSAAPGHSLVNPFDAFQVPDFNLWYFSIAVVMGIYSTMAWQNSHAFNGSSENPHESRMGVILGKWREYSVLVMVTLLGICGMTYLHTAAGSSAVDAALAHVSDPTTAKDMRFPVALSLLLPIGVKGMLAAVLLMGIIAGDGIHLHSWSSIFIQDVVMPLRRRALSPTSHVRILRLAVVGVALFAFTFGATFPNIEYIWIWWSITSAIFCGGAGAAIIGGLYWNRGTAQGAWLGMITGSVLATGGILIRLYYNKVLHTDFFLSAQVLGLIAMAAACVVYVTTSLVTSRAPFDMDRLLNRDKEAPAALTSSSWLGRVLYFDHHFTLADRFVTSGILAYNALCCLVFIVGTVAYLIMPWSNEAWANFWLIQAMAIPLVIGLVTTVWFTFGCSRDLIAYLRMLRTKRSDDHDDGSVTAGGHGSLH